MNFLLGEISSTVTSGNIFRCGINPGVDTGFWGTKKSGGGGGGGGPGEM